jgi:thiamine biosynthesis protein ThiS
MAIEILLNGELQALPEGSTILDLLRQIDLDPSRVAVELDRRIVKQAGWGDTVLNPGAQVEIVQFVGGG